MDKKDFIDNVVNYADAATYKWKIDGIVKTINGFKEYDPELAKIYAKFIDVNLELHEYCKGKLEK